MNLLAMFVLGLFVGWLIEWIIDWVYWRKRYKALEKEHAGCKAFVTEHAGSKLKIDQLNGEKQKLETQISGLKQEIEALKAQAAEKASHAERTISITPATDEAQTVASLKPDDLEIIKGIGPVIAKKLNQAGITTFQQLGELNAEKLREILGDLLQRLADEDDLLNQARQLAQRQG